MPSVDISHVPFESYTSYSLKTDCFTRFEGASQVVVVVNFKCQNIPIEIVGRRKLPFVLRTKKTDDEGVTSYTIAE